MSKQETFITSHRYRVKRAKDKLREWPEKVSFFDREAFVEFFLLEDVVRLYQYRLGREKAKIVNTRAGEMAKRSNVEKFTAIINIFESATEIAWGEITAGNYKTVWSAIPERALMVAANRLKYIAQLRELAVKLLRTLSESAMSATEQAVLLDEALDDIEDHEANVRLTKDLPSASEIEELIRAVEVAIPDERKSVKNKPTTRLN